MDKKVQAFLTENKEALHNQLLDELGIFEYEKEYMPDKYDKWQAPRLGYTQSETVDGETLFYKNGKKIYPSISDEEYDSLLRIAKEKDRIAEKENALNNRSTSKEKKPAQYIISAENTQDNSFAGKMLRALAWVYWIGGLIVAIFTSRVEVVSGYHTETAFQWGTFITSLILYISLGIACLCMAELHSNIYVIASSIQRFQAKEDKEDKKAVASHLKYHFE